MQENGKYNVLYVDDEENNLIVFKSAFRRNYNVYTANSASEGRALLEQIPFAVIITDQRMPVITGVQFLQNLPDDPENIRMILSGYSDVQAIIDAINKGKIYRYINKPWEKDELQAIIDEAITSLEKRLSTKVSISMLMMENELLKSKVAQLSAGLIH